MEFDAILAQLDPERRRAVIAAALRLARAALVPPKRLRSVPPA